MPVWKDGARFYPLGVEEVVIVAVLRQVAVNVVDRHRLVGRGAESGEAGEARMIPAEEVSAIFGVLMPLGAAVIAASCRPGPLREKLIESVPGLVAAVGLPRAGSTNVWKATERSATTRLKDVPAACRGCSAP